MRATGIIWLLALCLQGCGHKGPLYLPPQASAPGLPAPAFSGDRAAVPV